MYSLYYYNIGFPDTLKHKDLRYLRLKDKFNQDISSLAESFPNLTSLHLGYYFNQDISSLVGSFHNLTNLHLGSYFNQDMSSLANSFPQLKQINHWNYKLVEKYKNILKN